MTNILKIKEVFSALLNKKIIKIHNMVLSKLASKGRKIQTITKGLFKKQVIVS